MKLLAGALATACVLLAEPPESRCTAAHFEWPKYRPLAKQARISGTVNARVVIGPDGTVKTAAYTGHPVLVPSIQGSLAGSRPDSVCAGTEFDLFYRFVLVTAAPKQPVRFNPPNEFVVEAPPAQWQPSTSIAK